MSTAAEDLARFASELSLSDVPTKVIDKVKAHVLDTLASVAVGADEPLIQPARTYGFTFGKRGRSRVIGPRAETLDAEVAAFVNGSAAGACEIDDRHIATGHVGGAVVPAVLAVAEEVSASGADCLRAMLAAYEIASRTGIAVNGGALMAQHHNGARGFHNAGAYNGFGVAAGAGLLMGLGQQQILHAMSIAGSHASCLAGAGQTGQSRIHPGICAAGGIRSARLAQAGLDGTPTIFAGYLESFSVAPRPENLTESLGEEWTTLGNRAKPYPVNGTMFPQLLAMQNILSNNTLASSDIKEIRVGVDPMALAACSRRPEDVTNWVSFCFSSAYSLAVTVLKRSNDFHVYREIARTGYQDPEILRIARLVHLYLDPDCEALYPRQWPAKVTVVTHDGRTLESGIVVEPEMTGADIEAKTRRLLAHCMSTTQIEALIERVNSLETMTRIDDLSELLETAAA